MQKDDLVAMNNYVVGLSNAASQLVSTGKVQAATRTNFDTLVQRWNSWYNGLSFYAMNVDGDTLVDARARKAALERLVGQMRVETGAAPAPTQAKAQSKPQATKPTSSGVAKRASEAAPVVVTETKTDYTPLYWAGGAALVLGIGYTVAKSSKR